jgi:uncharacterized protein
VNVVVWPALGGGALIGAAASLLLVAAHETAGISGILEGLMRPHDGGRSWRAAFVAGLLVGGLALAVFAPGGPGTAGVFGGVPRPLGAVAVAGVLVGFGTRLGGGCTSGHGVCGISRLSLPSVVAVLTFIATGVATATLLRLAGGGS